MIAPTFQVVDSMQRFVYSLPTLGSALQVLDPVRSLVLLSHEIPRRSTDKVAPLH